jgi:hypothetical protein
VLSDVRDALVEAPPRERAAIARRLLEAGWAPARILSEAPFLPPAFVEGGDASRDRVSPAPARAAEPDPSGN